MKRISFGFFFLCSILFAQEGIDVLIAKKDIPYKNSISIDDFIEKKVPEIRGTCIPVSLKDLQNNEFVAKHFIRSGRILCMRNIKEDTASKVLFDFGTLEIERKAKVIHENDRYIKVRLPDGEVQKIYKNGLDE